MVLCVAQVSQIQAVGLYEGGRVALGSENPPLALGVDEHNGGRPKHYGYGYGYGARTQWKWGFWGPVMCPQRPALLGRYPTRFGRNNAQDIRRMGRSSQADGARVEHFTAFFSARRALGTALLGWTSGTSASIGLQLARMWELAQVGAGHICCSTARMYLQSAQGESRCSVGAVRSNKHFPTAPRRLKI